ncbi:CDP-diacylglycerol--glycerol-3-phosphate 3-phosphatidyltransferase [Spongiibacter nanhainus]|uniref:CDP-diacylglycerol--glycerol-3-phosphate 3-phosphatidyltransferase n=1 Tax=Spongiibacter nanhainus TaxID=2794344 RepID=A0A7T4QXS2_9GAMM|nr:CDP-diacylglycerol--glycerol-3-phosphate 3-phosphatidyltransferase [Spongiibacter nanhainus]QQD16706.1 CDP-diacylglycerol--glycerol-3-phosphate 3-phosphatidyltransferase [Spongiibacter nanhainus]
MTVPNALTLFRIILIPIFAVAFYLPIPQSYVITAALFGLAGLTDWLDGYLARRLGQTTALGAFLDPVADKLMVAVALAVLIERFHVWWFTLPAVIIIGREIVISALREWMAELGKRTSVAVSWLGKVKTTAQIVAIIGLLLVPPGRYPLLDGLNLVLLYVAAILTLWSMVMYLKAAWPELRENN